MASTAGRKTRRPSSVSERNHRRSSTGSFQSRRRRTTSTARSGEAEPSCGATPNNLLAPLLIEGGDFAPARTSRVLPPYGSHELMSDPVVDAGGHTYERVYIERWFHDDHASSPITGARLAHIRLVPNHSLRGAIEQFTQDRESERSRQRGRVDVRAE